MTYQLTGGQPPLTGGPAMVNGGSPPLTVIDRRRWVVIAGKYEVHTDMSVRGTRWQAEVSVRGT
ncbi:hypothetical protein Tco_0325991, partial [Tanacetum coccineum]